MLAARPTIRLADRAGSSSEVKCGVNHPEKGLPSPSLLRLCACLCTCLCFLCVSMCARVWAFVHSQPFVSSKTVPLNIFLHFKKVSCKVLCFNVADWLPYFRRMACKMQSDAYN